MNRIAILVLSLLVVIPLSGASAKPKRADGGTCESVGTARKDGKDQDGNTVNCKWDTCTYTKCDTSGGKIGKCSKVTEYSNPRDCKAAAGTTNGGILQSAPTGAIFVPLKRQDTIKLPGQPMRLLR